MNRLNDNLFRTDRTRNYYRGASFHFSGAWRPGVNYIHDEYKTDFVVYKNVLLACSQSHQAEMSTEPTDFMYDQNGEVIGIYSRYWDFVLAGTKGTCPMVKINEDGYWYICSDVEHPDWKNTGVKATPDLDISEDDMNEIKERVVREISEAIDIQIISQLQDSINSLQSQLTSLESRVSNLENSQSQDWQSAINNLQSQINSINTRIDNLPSTGVNIAVGDNETSLDIRTR